ncbi:MAG: hypothetical protein UT34_C0002G0256 [candidate division WS6 bacterium GW2011_GWF2_39_15]|uniref:Glycosyltransferase RgtA/B/C/D-like domain-containing protein n=1 Tax=candidate division WS6 bacterium GW2011_GWF2_39_15 TaxID=1619100 RepID=A0A0G0MNV7_9BACT|nr:MAG: hypothetical protein UT34_C0002G0256 [candidate division WS6 bacterium GW2011_GWF2_39_15]
MNKNQTEKKGSITLYQLLWLVISSIAFSGIVLLWSANYSPFKAIIGGLLGLVFLFTLFRWKIEIPRLKVGKIAVIFLFVLGIGIILRISPWMYLEGGQDEGLYISMSKQFDRTGRLQFDDIAVPKLKGDDLVRYEKEAGWAILGIKKADEGSLYYGFYPMHPMLMSVTGFIFGENHMTSSLTLFSILSIIGIFLLTKEISGSTLAGTIAGSLLAFSPLHLYFSRFPVTEILALSLTLNTFYFILRGLKTKSWTPLLIALFLINIFFYTRITWIIALPFYILMILAIMVYLKERKERIMWGLWGLLVLLTYLISLYFYYTQINTLYVLFYHDIFKIVPERWFYTLLGLIPLVVFLFSTVFRKYVKWVMEVVFKYRNIFIYIGLIILVVINLRYFYRMAFTDTFVGTRADYFWGMANKGWIIFKDTALMSLILYLTPVGVILFALSIKRVINTPVRVLLTIFLFLFLALNLTVNKFTPYHFYYARYQLSEIIPVIYVFISIYMVTLFRTSKLWFYLCLGFLTFYNLFFTAFQFQGYVGTTPVTFNQIQETVSKKDLIFFYDPTKWGTSFIVSPLKYFYNVPTAIVRRGTNLSGYLATSEAYDFNRYVLTTIVLNHEKLEYIKTFNFEKGFYASVKTEDEILETKINDYKIPYCDQFINEKFCAGIIPIKYHLSSIPLYLYKIK